MATAARWIVGGPLRFIFWGAFAIGAPLPLLLLVPGLLASAARPALLGFAGVFAPVGPFAYEHCFVVAGQVVPLS